jgi:hypothetical protein
MAMLTVQTRIKLARTAREKQTVTLQDGIQQQFAGLLIWRRQMHRNESRLSAVAQYCLYAVHIRADEVLMFIFERTWHDQHADERSIV